MPSLSLPLARYTRTYTPHAHTPIATTVFQDYTNLLSDVLLLLAMQVGEAVQFLHQLQGHEDLPLALHHNTVRLHTHNGDQL